MCSYFDDKPLRMKCMIPEELKKNQFFATCEPTLEHRAVRPLVIRDEGEEAGNQAHCSKSISTPKYVNESALQPQKKIQSIKVKGGTAVDPKSLLENIAHVFNRNGSFYTCVLGLTDIAKNKNSYYKLQVLEADPPGMGFWLFSSWGRIGTSIGDSSVETFLSADLACAKFENSYFEQTGNFWNSSGFVKLPGKFYPIDISYDDVRTNTDVASKLTPATEELMKLLFNVPNMKRAMSEFQLDLEKMPLGKLSARQLQTAYQALKELEDTLNKAGSKVELVGLSNKFYTLIPHNFGLAKAPIIDTTEKINQKREMVDSLMDIQNAYEMMRVSNSTQDTNSFDMYYKQLRADITTLDRASEEFQLINQYVLNTQMHGYKIEILEVFKVKRLGEDQRYQPYKNFHNRQLLWHGSRVTNFASIISNGLKIGAQVNGSMFGRGIYFADMISKSANYCRLLNVVPQNEVALLVLCEVALGTMYELQNATNVVRLPPGMHSVKGIGFTFPDKTRSHVRQDGVIIPLGAPARIAQQHTLIFNE